MIHDDPWSGLAIHELLRGAERSAEKIAFKYRDEPQKVPQIVFEISTGMLTDRIREFVREGGYSAGRAAVYGFILGQKVQQVKYAMALLLRETEPHRNEIRSKTNAAEVSRICKDLLSKGTPQCQLASRVAKRLRMGDRQIRRYIAKHPPSLR